MDVNLTNSTIKNSEWKFPIFKLKFETKTATRL